MVNDRPFYEQEVSRRSPAGWRNVRIPPATSPACPNEREFGIDRLSGMTRPRPRQSSIRRANRARRWQSHRPLLRLQSDFLNGIPPHRLIFGGSRPQLLKSFKRTIAALAGTGEAGTEAIPPGTVCRPALSGRELNIRIAALRSMNNFSASAALRALPSDTNGRPNPTAESREGKRIRDSREDRRGGMGVIFQALQVAEPAWSALKHDSH